MQKSTRSRGSGLVRILEGDVFDPVEFWCLVVEEVVECFAHDLEERLVLRAAGLRQRQRALDPALPHLAGRADADLAQDHAMTQTSLGQVVRGFHAGHPENERCDILATTAADAAVCR